MKFFKVVRRRQQLIDCDFLGSTFRALGTQLNPGGRRPNLFIELLDSLFGSVETVLNVESETMLTQLVYTQRR